MSERSTDPRRLEREVRRLRFELGRALETLPHLRRMVAFSGDPLLLVDGELRVLLCNARLADLLAVPEEVLHRQPLSRWLPLPQQAEVLRQRLEELAVGASLRMELDLLPCGGSSLPVELEAARLAPQEGLGEEACWTLALRDISERKRLASSEAMLAVQRSLCDDLRRSEERYRLLVDQLEDGLGELDRLLRLDFANPALHGLLGVGAGGLSGQSFEAFVHPLDRPVFSQLAGALLAGQARRCRLRVSAAGDAWRLLELRFSPRLDPCGQPHGTSLLARDVTALHRASERLEQLAFHDALTGLGNGESGLRWLREQLAVRPGRQLALLCLDLDGFRRVNHSFGRDRGDAVLRQVASVLRKLCRPGDCLARLSGDEFLVMRSGVDRAGAQALADQLQDALQEGLRLASGERLGLGFCAGISLSPDHSVDADTLLRQATTALSQAHGQGRGQVVVYEPTLTTGLVAELDLEGRLRQALELDAFELVYQPQLDAAGQLLGSEALLRWHDPEHGPISPMTFIPVAERSGLIHELGHWVLDRVCRQQSRWQARGLPLRPVAVNVSPLQLLVRPSLVERLSACLERHGLPARLLELEITESTLLPISAVSEQLVALAGLGVRLALDDFGTGFSSLESLHRLPLHRVKIDKSFVLQLTSSHSSQVIVRTAVAMARGLGLDCVVEGVETAEQLAMLAAMEANAFQGFHFCRPLELPAYEALLQRGWISAAQG